MRRTLTCLLVAALLVSCGDSPGSSDQPDSGVEGRVLLGPTCPVETEGEPCDDAAAIAVDVTVHEPSTADPMTPGEVVAEVVTDDDGSFRVDLEPGPYLVTATAGMFCDVVPVSVEDGRYAAVDLTCDTGIR